MKHTQEHINDLLKKFRDGSISKDERHELEKQALDDPFLFEALEGYARFGDVNNDITLASIKKEQRGKVRNKVFRLQPIGIAAGFLILIAATFWLNGSLSKKPDSLARTSQKQETNLVDQKDLATKNELDLEPVEDLVESESKPLGSSFENLEVEDQLQEIEADAIEIEESSVAQNEEQPPEKVIDIPTQARKESVEKETFQTESIPLSKSENLAGNVPSKAKVQSSAQSKRNTDLKKEVESEKMIVQQALREISGIIRDNTGEPLIGASLNVVGSTNATVSDIDGKFVLNLDETTKELVISYTGYNQQTIQLDADQDYYDLILEEGVALDEVVVYGGAETISSDEPQFINPPGGRKQFKELIENKSRTANCDLKGKVRLRFIVDIKGRLSDFEVRKGLSDECDKIAIEIIKSSGIWDNPFDRSKKVRYTVSF